MLLQGKKRVPLPPEKRVILECETGGGLVRPMVSPSFPLGNCVRTPDGGLLYSDG